MLTREQGFQFDHLLDQETMDHQLFKNLPQEEREHFKRYDKQYDPSQIEQFIEKIRSPADPLFWSKENLPQISRLSLIAFFRQLMTWQEMATLHLVIEVWLEYIYEVSFSSLISKDGLRTFSGLRTFNFSLSKQDQKLIEKEMLAPHHFRRFPFDVPSSFDEHDQPTNEAPICREVEILYGKGESGPIIKKYFRFNDQEWDLFTSVMRDIPVEERVFYYMELPYIGTPSAFLALKQKYTPLYSKVRVFYKRHFSTTMIPRSVLIIPSFSLWQTFLIAKALFLKKWPWQLVPEFGEASAEDFAELKSRMQAPLGLYYPSSKNLNEHTRKLDGLPTHGYTFTLHDLDHVRFDKLYRTVKPEFYGKQSLGDPL